MKKQNIIKLYAGINYIRQNGTSQAKDFDKKFRLEHPNAIEYFGDLRSEKRHFKTVYKLLTYNYNGIWSNKWKSTYKTYIEN